ncbi:MAG: ATP-binding protein [Acutalibacteraceae bacterium]|nr:ATP-binding protein [Acutalibacteraceae bacterium]
MGIFEEIARKKEELKDIISDSKRMSEVDLLNSQKGSLTGYDCVCCQNKGVIYYNDEDGLYVVPCTCMQIRKALRRIRDAGLEKLVDKCTLSNFITKEPFQKAMKQLAMDYLNDGGIGFFIGGQSGCGKTHICTAVTGQLIYRGSNAAYMQWRDDSVKLKQYANDPIYEALVNRYKFCSVLYIDDLFKTQAGKSPTQADINLFFEIINSRYIQQERTIISSEWTLEQILDFDEACGSRIAELCADYIINISPDRAKNFRLR